MFSAISFFISQKQSRKNSRPEYGLEECKRVLDPWGSRHMDMQACLLGSLPAGIKNTGSLTCSIQETSGIFS